MIDVEPLIESSFARLFPEPAVAADWDGVLDRAGMAAQRRRRNLVALAFAVAVIVAVVASPLGAGIAHSLGDFSDWLRGEPGKPASQAAQQAFDRANQKSWTGFPKGTRLRELITTSNDGVEYTLYGLRSQGSLCLRLVAEGAAHGGALSCAPLRELRNRNAPVLVMEVDQPIGTLPGRRVQVGPDRFTLDRASVSFGIVADNVAAVRLRSDDQTREATITGNAFLAVATRPPAGNRVHAVSARLRSGRWVRIPFAEVPFGMYGAVATSSGTLHGPVGIERKLTSGTVSWLTHREPRGAAWPKGRRGLVFFVGNNNGHFVYGRVIQPDRQNRFRVGLSLWQITKADKQRRLQKGTLLCITTFLGSGGGSGCGPIKDLFARSPINVGSMTVGGGDQYSILSGAASDDVARVRLYLGTGEIIPVPLRDNAFVTQVSRAKYPIRIVAYDNRGRVIANTAIRNEGGPSGPAYRPARNGHWTKLLAVTTAGGGKANLWTIPSQAGGVCWQLRSPDLNMGGCTPPDFNGALREEVVPSGGGKEPVLVVETSPAVDHVVISYHSGVTATEKPVHGFVVYAILQARVAARDRITHVTAYGDSGAAIGRLTMSR